MVHAARTLPAAHTNLIDQLNAWKPIDQGQIELHDEYVSFVRSYLESALDRDGGLEHVTASCFVFTPDFEQVLLCFHKKGQFWVQLGGHVETTDVSVGSAAIREAREEGGINDITRVGGILDLDRHALGPGFTRCSVHWDIGFGAIAMKNLNPSTSSESEDVAWWPISALPENVPPDFEHRLRRILDGIREQGDAGYTASTHESRADVAVRFGITIDDLAYLNDAQSMGTNKQNVGEASLRSGLAQ